jgi:hypothetical protein
MCGSGKISMKIIKIAKKYEIKIDETEYEKYSQQNYVWDIVYKRRGVIRYVRVMPRGSAGAKEARKQFKRYRLHRLIMGITDPKIIVDHINRNPLDNRKSNLRLCTIAENSRNSGIISSRNTSGYKGVTKSSKKWLARIEFNGKKMYLGSFNTPQAAAEAYDKKAVELFGEFACTNKMLGKLE